MADPGPLRPKSSISRGVLYFLGPDPVTLEQNKFMLLALGMISTTVCTAGGLLGCRLAGYRFVPMNKLSLTGMLFQNTPVRGDMKKIPIFGVGGSLLFGFPGMFGFLAGVGSTVAKDLTVDKAQTDALK